MATLTLMVGPSGAGKSTWLLSDEAKLLGITPDQVISSDSIRAELCGDFKDQRRNKEVFKLVKKRASDRLDNGQDTVIDATNLSYRPSMVALNGNNPIRYIVVNRSVEEKRRDGGWRNDLSIDLIGKHDQLFQLELPDIMCGDGLSNVTVYVGGKIDTSSQTDTVSGANS